MALSGGGLRGYAHIGVLQVLDSVNIQPNSVGGVSIGAFIGAMYALGYETDEMIDLMQSVQWEGLFFDEQERRKLPYRRKEEFSRHLMELRFDSSLTPMLPSAVSPGQNLQTHLMSVMYQSPFFSNQNWSDGNINLGIIATDLNSGTAKKFTSGDVTVAIRGSLAFPLLLEPLLWDSMQLVDGGIHTYLPSEMLREMGSEIVIGVDASTPMIDLNSHVQPWEVVSQVTTILQRFMIEHSIEFCDLIITPEAGDETFFNAKNVINIVQAGKNATLAALPEIESLLKLPLEPPDTQVVNISKINTDDAVLIDYFKDFYGDVSIYELKKLISQIYKFGDVLNVSAEYSPNDSTLHIVCNYSPVVRNFVLQGDVPNELREDALDLLGSLLNESINRHSFEKTMRRLLRLYRQHGYPTARIMETNWEETHGVISINMEIGTLNNILVKGLNKISLSSINNEILVKPDTTVTQELILRGMGNLYSTGYFKSVFPIISQNEENGNWDVTYLVNEYTSHPLRLGLAYIDEQRVRGFAEFSMQSRIISLARMTFFASFGERDFLHRVSHSADRIRNFPFGFDLSLRYSESKRSIYNNNHSVTGEFTIAKYGYVIDAGLQATRWGVLSITNRGERYSNQFTYFSDQSGMQTVIESDDKYYLSTFGLRMSLDTYNRSPFPTNGIRFDSIWEIASEHTGSDYEFTRFSASWDGFISPRHRVVTGLRSFWRIADRTTPFSERYRMGGMHNFPGLHLDELSGLMQIAGGVEVRYDLLSRLLSDAYIGMRLDTGSSLNDNQLPINREDMFTSASVYFALDTFLGPMQIQFARLIASERQKANKVINLQIGNNF